MSLCSGNCQLFLVSSLFGPLQSKMADFRTIAVILDCKTSKNYGTWLLSDYRLHGAYRPSDNQGDRFRMLHSLLFVKRNI